MDKEGADAKGTINDLRKRCKNNTPPIPTKKKCSKLIKGCVGQPIGLIEILWRRRYADPALPNKELPNDKAYRAIAKEMPQLRDELSEAELVMNELDIEVVLTLKAHCKLAGRGIECLWRAAKMMF